MTAFRPLGRRDMAADGLQPGDTVLESQISAAVSTVGATTLTAAQLLTTNIYRSGSTAAYTDTFDTSSNLYQALAGNDNGPQLQPGLGFDLVITNQVAFAQTITLGAGMIAGSGTISSVSASSWRQFSFDFLCCQPPTTVVASGTSGSPNLTWTLQPGQQALQEGVAVTAVNIQVGATAIGTSIPANTTVLSVTQGVGGTIGVVLSANLSANISNGAIAFVPTVSVSSPGSGTL
jgi:hypothetical protein